MQKKIIALAVAAVASTGAFAQSNVTIYGNLDAGFQSLTGTHKDNAGVYNVGAATAASINGINSGLNTSSLIGFRGQEDLGNGMKGLFNIEYNVNADGGNAAGGTGAQGAGANGTATSYRQVYVGMSGGFGTVSLGRHYTPFFLAAKTLDPFGAVGVGSILAIHPVGYAGVTRAGNSINYTSPNMNGFVLGALYGMGEETVNGAVSMATSSLKAVYANGPLLVGAVFIRLADATGAVGQHVYSTAIGGTYQFAPMKLHMMYNSLRSSGATATTLVGAAANTDFNNGDWMIGLTVPMGMGTIKAAINRGNDKTVQNQDATHVGLGYQYNMSKRTNLYVQYGHVSNNADGSYSMTSGTNQGLAAFAGARTTGFSMGMGHSF